jgi:hypothetical protein
MKRIAFVMMLAVAGCGAGAGSVPQRARDGCPGISDATIAGLMANFRAAREDGTSQLEAAVSAESGCFQLPEYGGECASCMAVLADIVWHE